MDIAQFVRFRFKCFRFVSIFLNFFVSVFVNRIKIFPITDISIFDSVNINHTGYWLTAINYCDWMLIYVYILCKCCQES